MDRWPHLARAPIVEGLIDIRVERSTAVTLEQLRAAGDELAPEFPARSERRHWKGRISLSPMEAPQMLSATEGSDAIMLRSTDQKWVAQFQLDGLTVSRLSPYSSWQELQAFTVKLWKHYSLAAQPLRANRIATRFINCVPLPHGEPIERTFSTTFSLSASLPQTVAGFLLRIAVPFEREEAMAIMTQTLEPSGSDCIFDVDAFSESHDGFTEEALWKKLEVLRDVKNRLFFESLTSNALERFK